MKCAEPWSHCGNPTPTYWVWEGDDDAILRQALANSDDKTPRCLMRLFLMIVTAMVLACGAVAEPTEPTMTVTGEGRVAVAPDMAMTAPA